MSIENEDAGFWPAYVASMAGLVQSLLLVVSILAVALYQMGGRMAEKMDAAEALQLVSPAPAPVPGRAGMMLAMGRGVQSQPAAARQAALQSRGGTWRLMIRFTGSTIDLGEKTRGALAEQLQRFDRGLADKNPTNGDVKHWQVGLSVDTSDRIATRAAYLRVLEVRNAMIAAGVAPGSIAVRLDPASPATEIGLQQTVFVDWLPSGPGRSLSAPGRTGPSLVDPVPAAASPAEHRP